MSLHLYTDQNFHGDVTEQLRRRGVDILTAEEDGSKEMEDGDLLGRAGKLGRVSVAHDRDMLAEATHRSGRVWISSVLFTRTRFESRSG